ncbi:MAG: FimV/HubP family polar landmark protein, partial [Colwellia sp.]
EVVDDGPAELTDPDDIDALMDSIAETPTDPTPEVVDDGPAELTDPDDIDALMDSMAATPTDPIPEVVDDGPAELTDPDDIDALMDSMVKESAVAELNDKPENFEISDPDDIDALLDSMADPEEVSKPITADDIVDPLDDLAADKLDENLDLTDPDDIDSLLGDIQGNEGQPSNEAPMQADTDIAADEIETTEDENKALIENFTNDYVAPFLSVDFSALLNDDTEELIDDADVSTSENKNLSDDLDIDALLAEVADSDNSLTNELDIGDDILTNGQANEQGSELSTDYTDSDVLADLLADEKPTQSDAVSHNSESDAIEDLDNVDFDELLANIEEGHKPSSSDLDLSDDFTTDDIDLDTIDSAAEQPDDEEDFGLDLDDALDIGDDLDSDNNLNIDFDSDEDDFVSVDSLLSDSLGSTNDEEPYSKTDFNVGLSEFPEFSGDNSAEDEDDNGIAAKLDLAKVYIEIGDNENAEVILQDVVEKGDAQQQFDAQQLLDNISL